MDLVRQLPAGMGRKAELKDLSAPAAIEKGRQLGLSTISPGTINVGYLAHMSALFGWAEKEDWADKNPFKGLAVHDPVEARDKRDPFSMDQLATLFSAAPWSRPLPHDDKRPGRFWVPLIALFTGMRLGEIAGLRLMDVEDRNGVSVFNIRPYEGRSLKNPESRGTEPPVPIDLEALLAANGPSAPIKTRVRAIELHATTATHAYAHPTLRALRRAHKPLRDSLDLIEMPKLRK
ncbi:MAG: hypothetical protein PGN16_09215 [Sphingomonas phyllosphaerae]|uniref:hypothetical protein n=1 Tax=Sphingomonas phyllosphaerae TaxID=257003 RepID=UPI002FF698DB